MAPAPASAVVTPTCAPRNNVGNFDLSSVFHIQGDYLDNVVNSSANNLPEIVGYVDDVQTRLSTLSKNFSAANTSSQAVLAHQQEMLDIVNAEKLRLQEKQQLVDSADMQQQHVMLLNDTYRKKYREYTKIVIVVVIGVSAFVLIRMLSDFLQISEWISVVLHIINILVCVIAITTVYATIQSRSSINFDRIEISPPTTGPAAATTSLDSSANSLFGSFCLGSDCCDTKNGVAWNNRLQMCVANKVVAPAPAPEGFDTYSPYRVSMDVRRNEMLPRANGGGHLAAASLQPLDNYGTVSS